MKAIRVANGIFKCKLSVVDDRFVVFLEVSVLFAAGVRRDEFAGRPGGGEIKMSVTGWNYAWPCIGSAKEKMSAGWRGYRTQLLITRSFGAEVNEYS